MTVNKIRRRRLFISDRGIASQPEMAFKALSFTLFQVLLLLLVSCGGQPTQPQTLGDIDTPEKAYSNKQSKNAEPPRDNIKKAYYDYISGAAKDDRFRLMAATRIAELELSLQQDKEIDIESEAYQEKIRQTIKLLEDALKDFPDAQDNDHSLYQLAKAYDQIAESEKAVEALKQLVTLYPRSPYFVEAKFRIAEHEFIHGEYFPAEDAYTDVIKHPNNELFLEKALFKRGWARYKQELYDDALGDFYQAINYHKFAPYDNLQGAERELFEEYFRAIGLTFTYLGGTEAIYAYHKQLNNPQYIYRTYDTVARLFLKQERISDSVDVYEGYTKYYPRGDRVVEAGMNVLKIWKDEGFFNRYVASFESFYQNYHIGSPFWTKTAIPARETQYQQANETIRRNIVLLAGYYHNQYVKSGKTDHFKSAEIWYERYLQEYDAYARQDKIAQLYAQILDSAGRNQKALYYYEQAAFDGNLILDKDSAYAAVYLTDQLLKSSKSQTEQSQYLDKHLLYASLFAQYYPEVSRTPGVVQNAVQLATKNQKLQAVIDLANLLPDRVPRALAQEVNILKAQAYFDLGFYEDAELVYQDLLADASLTQVERDNITDKLALALYEQGEASQETGQTAAATAFFLRIYHELPSSELAATAVYDAIALFMQNEQWDQAIQYLNAFKRDYPQHPYQKDVTKKLSLAYLKSDRGIDAAREFEKLSDYVTNQEEKMAAQWQAAQLYYEKGDLSSALRAYKEYAHTYKRPFPQNMEAMFIISDIYQRMGERNKKIFWLKKMIDADAKAAASSKTERTHYIAANAAYNLAYLTRDDFAKIKLRIPLAKSLKAKKQSMQTAVKLYGKAASSGYEEFATQSTLAIAEIYQEFAKALMESERPKNLNDDELEQYNILIEDQVFPFEDKAIEFYEANIKRIASGIYDDAIKESLKRLATLYPARYARSPKVELVVEKLVIEDRSAP